MVVRARDVCRSSERVSCSCFPSSRGTHEHFWFDPSGTEFSRLHRLGDGGWCPQGKGFPIIYSSLQHSALSCNRGAADLHFLTCCPPQALARSQFRAVDVEPVPAPQDGEPPVIPSHRLLDKRWLVEAKSRALMRARQQSPGSRAPARWRAQAASSSGSVIQREGSEFGGEEQVRQTQLCGDDLSSDVAACG